MARFTVYRNPNGKGYLLDLQADINSHFSTRVVAPLIPIGDIPAYAKSLNPVFEIEGERVVMATQGMAAVPLAILKQPIRPDQRSSGLRSDLSVPPGCGIPQSCGS